GTVLFLSTPTGVREYNLPTSTGVASTLRLTGFPAFISAGTPGSFTLTALDPAGNVATGYSGTIHFTSTDASATLPADYTFVASDNGVHTFSAALQSIGSQSLTATDSGNSLAVTQSNISVHGNSVSLIPVSARRDLVFDAGRGILYITTTAGTVERYQV